VVAGCAVGADQIPQMHHAHDVVQTHRAGDRGPGVPALDKPLQRVRGRQVRRQDQHVAAGNEDLAQDPVGDLERAADDGALFGGESPLRLHHVADLVRADLFARGVGVTAGDPHDEVGGFAEQPHRGPGDPGERVQRPGHQHRPAFGTLHRDPFRRQLPHHQGEERQHDSDQHDRSRAGRAAEEAQRLDERLGQRHGRRRGGQEPGQGDTDLDGGQEAVRIPGQPRQGLAGPRRSFHALQLTLAKRDQRHFTAGECGIKQHQNDDQTYLKPVAAHGGTTLLRHSATGHRLSTEAEIHSQFQYGAGQVVVRVPGSVPCERQASGSDHWHPVRDRKLQTRPRRRLKAPPKRGTQSAVRRSFAPPFCQFSSWSPFVADVSRANAS
jgi:hypothetical protein